MLSAQLLSYFTRNGHEFTKNVRDTDIAVINTCGFIDEAKKLSISLIEDMCNKCSPDTTVISIGCLTQIDRQKLEKKFMGLHIIEHLEQLDTLINAKVPICEISLFHYERISLDQISHRKFYIPNFLLIAFCRFSKVFKKFPFSQILEEEIDENKVFIQIGSGCLNQCSYCVIKKARGRAVSRPIQDILDEIKRIYRRGISLNLVADDCGTYGVDRGEDLIRLLCAINQAYPGIPLELSYLHPRWLNLNEDSYLEAFRKLTIKSVNVSLQSGSDRILLSMKRGYSANETVRIFTKIKKASPTTLIWGHFMVGYPLECWKDFYLTLQATRYYDFFHVFGYSPVNNYHDFQTRCAGYTILLRRVILKIVFYYRLLYRLIF